MAGRSETRPEARLRSGDTRTPVLFLTAKDATEDKVRGLTLGGDDYVTRPFSLEEVIARIRAVLRRASSGGPAGGCSCPRPSSSCCLMTNAGRVLSKAQILDYIWNYDFRGDSSIVESYVSYLRRKVDAVEPRLIHTIRSVGYVLRLPDP